MICTLTRCYVTGLVGRSFSTWDRNCIIGYPAACWQPKQPHQVGSGEFLGSLYSSVRSKPGFGIGNRNQDQVSVLVSGPELFLPKPKLSPIYQIYQKLVQLWPERLRTAFRLSRWYRCWKSQKKCENSLHLAAINGHLKLFPIVS